MIRVNLMTKERDIKTFCAAMDKLFSCRAPHCDKPCWAMALRDVQGACNKGATIAAAAKKWAETGLTHREGEEILKDILGVRDMGALRKYLSGETL
jgi:hypothetical protein